MFLVPPGASKVILVKLIYFNDNNDSIKDIPVSEAPTTTILVLLEILFKLNNRFVVKAKLNEAISSSNGFLSPSYKFLIFPYFYKYSSSNL